jgi:hypothetical protein
MIRPQPRRPLRVRPRTGGALLRRHLRHGGHRPGAAGQRRLPAAAPIGQTTTTSASSVSAPPVGQSAGAPSACTTSPGRSTLSTISPRPVGRWSATAPTPASRATAPPRASTVPTPTATTSRSCGCCPATTGVPTSTRRQSILSTSPPRSVAGAVSGPLARSPPNPPRASHDQLHSPVTFRGRMATQRVESPSAGPPTLYWGSLLSSDRHCCQIGATLGWI